MPQQADLPGVESPDRDDELHALGLELYSLQEERMALTKEEKEKREVIAAALRKREIDHYHCDGVELWIEPGPSKVKVRKDAAPSDEDAEDLA